MGDIERELKALGDRVSRRPSVLPSANDIVRRARMRRIVAGVTALGVVAATAIGGMAAIRSVETVDGGIPAEGMVLAAAADATEAEGTARIEYEMTMKSDGGFMAMDAQIHGSGEVDFAEQRSYLRSEVEDVPMAPITSAEMIQDGNDIYTRFGNSTQWTKTSASEFIGGATNLFSGMPSSPDDYLEQLRLISDEIEIVADDEVGGVSTTHYRATIDAETATAHLEGADESVQRVISEMDIEFDPIEVWVDDDGLVRKVTFGTTASTDDSGTSMDVEGSMRFFDFGTSVKIEVPDPDDVTEQQGVKGVFGGPESANESVTRYPIKTTFLFTRNGPSGPIVTIQESQPFDMMCLIEAPRWVRVAQVVERASGQSVAVMGEITESSFPDFEGETCEDELGDVSELKKHPKRFDLKLIGKGRSRTVAFSGPQKMLEPEE